MTGESPLSEIVKAIQDDDRRRFALAELSDRLERLESIEFAAAVDCIAVRGLDPLWQNYVAAMVEHTAHSRGVNPPKWTNEVSPLPEPHFATSLESLRNYLLQVSPMAFKRRNIFVDATGGDRV